MSHDQFLGSTSRLINLDPVLIIIFYVVLRTYCVPGSTLHGYLSKILARSCQNLGKILAKILSRYWQELQDVMVRSYQESHVPKKTLL